MSCFNESVILFVLSTNIFLLWAYSVVSMRKGRNDE